MAGNSISGFRWVGGSPVQLLAFQGLLAGFTLSVLYGVAYGRFLLDYGSEGLPWMYMVSAVAIPAVTFFYNRYQQNAAEGRFLLTVSTLLFVAYFATWLIVILAAGRWASYLIFVFYNIAFTFQIVLITIQSGRLFDLRQMKTQYPYVLASMTGGLILGGFAISLLTGLLGGVNNLLLVCAISSGFHTLGVWTTTRRFRDQFSAKPKTEIVQRRATWRDAFSDSFSRNIFAYQFLSFLGTELIIFNFALQAERRFTTADSMATFFGNLMAIATFLTLVFLVGLAGRLLKRFGLGYGIMMNPSLVILLVIALMVTQFVEAPILPIVFGLVIALRILDFTFSASTTDPSVKTMYQAIPERTRPIVLTAVDVLGYPLTYGFVGVTVLLFRALNITSDLFFFSYTLVVSILWVFFGWRTYSQYTSTLLNKLTRRTVENFEIEINDPASYAIVSKLAFSPDPSRVRLALNLLEKAEHRDYAPTLMALIDNRNPAVQIEAISRLERFPEIAIKSRVGQIAKESLPSDVRAAALQTHLASGDAKALETAVHFLKEDDIEVQRGALVGLLRYGGLAGHVAAGQRMLELTESDAEGDQLLLAQTLAAPGEHNFHQPLPTLINSPSAEVRRYALQAAGNVRHPALIPIIIDQLQSSETRSAAVDTLLAYGPAMLPHLTDALTEAKRPIEIRERLIHLSGGFEEGFADVTLASHLRHPERPIRDAVRSALKRRGYRASTPADLSEVELALKEEALFAAQLLGVEAAIGETVAYQATARAMRTEFDGARVQLLQLFALLYDDRALSRISDTLRSGSTSERAQVIETIDLLFSAAHKRLMLPLIEGALSPKQRLATLPAQYAQPDRTVEGWLEAVLKNGDGHFSDWTLAWVLQETLTADPDRWRPFIDSLEVTWGPIAAETLAAHDPPNAPGGSQMLTIEKISILKETSVFQDVPEDVLASVAQIVELVELSLGRKFIEEGDLANEMFIIVDGAVKVEKNGQTVIELEAGDTVGELALFDPEPRSADVITTEPTVLMRLEKETLREVMADRPEISDGVIRALARRIREQGRRMAESGSHA